jgi:hypothetical protein
MKKLTHISILTLAIALLIQSTTAQAQNASAQSAIKARGRGTRLILNSQGKKHVLDVSQSVDAAKLDEVSVLFATRRADFLYLLVAACGSSKLKPDDRQCGAGEECNLLWIKLNSKWQINDIKAVRYESCWAPITSNDGYKIKGNTLLLEYSDFREKKEYKLTYDADRPEGGFHVEEAAMKDDAPG